MDCPFLGNDEESWVVEILFKQNLDRYNLIEWGLSKLGLSIPNEDKYQSSLEVKAKYLMEAISSLGIVEPGSSDIIQGTAPLKRQLAFWKSFVDILWRKYVPQFQPEIVTCTESLNTITGHYKVSSNYINRVCESVNLNHLFKEKVQLFPSYLLKAGKESRSLQGSEVPSVKEISKLLSNSDIDLITKYPTFTGDLCFPQSKDSSHEEKLDKLEVQIGSSLQNLQTDSCQDLNHAYDILKLSLDVPTNNEKDLGPVFQTASEQLNDLLKLSNSLANLKSSETDLHALNTDLMKFEAPTNLLSDDFLREFRDVLRIELEMEQKL